MLKGIFQQNKSFLLPYLILLFTALPFLLLIPKDSLHLWMNSLHTNWGDFFFKKITFLGDGLFVLVACILMLFFSLRYSLFLLSAYISTGVVVQLLKHLAFNDIVRPVKYFQNKSVLYLVDGVHIYYRQSFPSGHATSAFALFLCLAMITKKKWIKLVCLLMACLVAYSRVYLSQHFFIDIYAGSVIGCAGAITFYYLYFSKYRSYYSWSIPLLFKKNGSGK
jgi:membrane-associated phospholipid phosphatase